MARVPGTFGMDAAFEVSIRKPLDSRSIVPTFADLTTESNWLNADGKSVVYNGQLVAVADKADVENSGIYYFFDTAYSSLKGGTVSDINNWHKVAELSELNAVIERVAALENATPEAGLSTDEVNALISAQVEALRNEIANSEYLTKSQLEEYGYITAAALEGFAKVEDIPEVPSLDGYATKAELDAAIEAIPETDLTNYYTKAQTDEAISTAIANAELGDKDVDLTAYYTKTETDTAIQTAVDAIQIPSLDGYATETFVTDKIAEIPEVDLSEYAKKTELPSTEGFATEEFVRTSIDAIPPVDLSEYAKKTEVPSVEGLASETFVTEQISAIPVDTFATKDDIKDFATDAEIDSKLSAYALKTDIPSHDGLASITYVDEQIATRPTAESVESMIGDAIADIPPTDLSDYYTKAQIDAQGYQTANEVKTAVDAAIAAIPKTDLSAYSTTEQVDAKIATAQSNAATSAQNYTDSQISILDAKITAIEIPDVSNFVTGTEVDTKIETATADFTTKTYVDDEVAKKANIDDIPSLDDYAKTSEVTATIDSAISAINIDTYATTESMNAADATTLAEAKKYADQLAVSGEVDLSNYATKADVSNANTEQNATIASTYVTIANANTTYATKDELAAAKITYGEF